MKLAILKNNIIERIQDAQIDQLASNGSEIVYMKYANSIEITNEQETKFNLLNKNECLDKDFNVLPDYSKETIYDIHTKEIIHLEKGQTIPTNGTIEKPTYSDDVFISGKWELSQAKQKEIKSNEIYKKYFDKESNGVIFTGSFQDDKGNNVSNPVFQYDETSQARLYKYKDISDVNYWRTLDNRNIILNNSEKNNLYLVLITEWANDFNNRLKELEAL